MLQQVFFKLKSPTFKRNLALFFLWLVILLGLISARAVLLPFLVATLLAYVFHPLVGILGKIKINNKPMPRVISVIIIYLFFALLFFLFCTLFVPQFYLEIVRLTKDMTVLLNDIDESKINELGQKIEDFFRAYNLPLEIAAPVSQENYLNKNLISIDLLKISKSLLNDITMYVKSHLKNIIFSTQQLLGKIMSFIFTMLLIVMITGFLLVDVSLIKRFIFSLVPISNQEDFDMFLAKLDKRMSGVVRGQLTICLVNAALTLIGLLFIKVKFAFILATIAGIFSLVPIFGSIASTIPIVLVAMTMSLWSGLLSLLWIVGIHILEANLLNPKIMGNSAKIHPVLIIFALIAGEHFYGVIGALLAVPFMSIVITIFIYILEKSYKSDEGVANLAQSDTITKNEV